MIIILWLTIFGRILMLHCPDVDYEAIIRVGNISEKYQDGM